MDACVARRQYAHSPISLSQNYKALKFISRGAFGQVFLCRDLRDERIVAIKVFHRPPDDVHVRPSLLLDCARISRVACMHADADLAERDARGQPPQTMRRRGLDVRIA